MERRLQGQPTLWSVRVGAGSVCSPANRIAVGDHENGAVVRQREPATWRKE